MNAEASAERIAALAALRGIRGAGVMDTAVRFAQHSFAERVMRGIPPDTRLVLPRGKSDGTIFYRDTVAVVRGATIDIVGHLSSFSSLGGFSIIETFGLGSTTHFLIFYDYWFSIRVSSLWFPCYTSGEEALAVVCSLYEAMLRRAGEASTALVNALKESGLWRPQGD